MIRHRPVARSASVAFAAVPARLLHLLAVLLLAWQALAGPVHRHAEASASVSATGVVVAAPARDRPDQPADCPVCREVAHAGPLLAPGGATLVVPAASAVVAAVALFTALRGDARSHSWRSRAPPVVGL